MNIVIWGSAFLVGMLVLGLIGARFFASLHNWGYCKGYLKGYEEGFREGVRSVSAAPSGVE